MDREEYLSRTEKLHAHSTTCHLEQLTTQVFTVPFDYVMLCNIRLVLLYVSLSTVIGSMITRNSNVFNNIHTVLKCMELLMTPEVNLQ